MKTELEQMLREHGVNAVLDAMIAALEVLSNEEDQKAQPEVVHRVTAIDYANA